jgi:hypothetical protein
LDILYLINTHTSNGQHKEPCHHQHKDANDWLKFVEKKLQVV